MRKTQGQIDILVVDDRLDGLIAIEAVLSCQNINVVRAQSGAEALSLLSSYDFAVILLDVQMPIMDGFETAARIKESEIFKHIPILFVTAINNDDRYIYRGYESGAVDYLFKPFDPIVLRSKVSVFIELHCQAKRIREQEMRLLEIERTERVRQINELEVESLGRYESLANAVPHIICRTRADSSPDYFNRAWTDYTGFSLEASLGSGFHDAFHREDLSSLLRTWVDALISARPFEADCRIRRADGEYRWHYVRAVPERRPSGEVIAWIGTAIDIDDRIRANQEMTRAKEEAESASVAKTQFLANVSHEIRTPLSAIIGFSELLLNPSQDAEDRLQCASTIHRNGQSLLNLINEILDISKVEAGKMELELQETDVRGLLQEISSLFELKANEKGLLLEVAIDGEAGVPAAIETDPMRLRQILVNIVANAVKFTDKGSVRVSVGELGGKLIMRISDTGLGIPQESRERLFQPFSQVDNSTTRRFGGTGLGLVLSKRFAESLGGDVALLASGSRGSLFEASIVCKAVGSERLKKGVIRQNRNSVILMAEPERGALDGFSLLLVDDAVDNQVLISRFLRMAGASVVVAGGGEEAIAQIGDRRNNFDLILMDLQMPGMDGYEATGVLRKTGWTKPIVALTAHALKSERDKCLAAGFDDHFTKPIDRMKLIASLTVWLMRSKILGAKAHTTGGPRHSASTSSKTTPEGQAQMG